MASYIFLSGRSGKALDESEQPPPNPARDVQNFVGEVMAVASKPVDMANLGVAQLTQGLSNALPSFPAARLFQDLVFGWPHSHPHAPTFGVPLPSIGMVILAGSRNVLINGLPVARSGDLGFAAWCGGNYPLFEVVNKHVLCSAEHNSCYVQFRVM